MFFQAQEMTHQPHFLKQNLVKNIYLYSVLLICSSMFLFKGNEMITDTIGYCTFNPDIQFQEFVDKEKKYYCNMDKLNINIFCQKLNEQQLDAEKKKFVERELFRQKNNILRGSFHILLILIFAFFHLLILRKNKENISLQK